MRLPVCVRVWTVPVKVGPRRIEVPPRHAVEAVAVLPGLRVEPPGEAPGQLRGREDKVPHGIHTAGVKLEDPRAHEGDERALRHVLHHKLHHAHLLPLAHGKRTDPVLKSVEVQLAEAVGRVGPRQELVVHVVLARPVPLAAGLVLKARQGLLQAAGAVLAELVQLVLVRAPHVVHDVEHEYVGAQAARRAEHGLDV